MKILDQLVFINEAASIDELRQVTERHCLNELSQTFNAFSTQSRLSEKWKPGLAAEAMYYFLQAIRRDIISSPEAFTGRIGCARALCASMLVGPDVLKLK